jgi:predicted PurR-regulated permease PerM
MFFRRISRCEAFFNDVGCQWPASWPVVWCTSISNYNNTDIGQSSWVRLVDLKWRLIMDRTVLSAEAVDVAIRLSLLGLLAYWSWKIVAPFATIFLWSAILAIALYPLFDWMQNTFGRPKLAASLITLSCVVLVLAPVTWLGLGLLNGAEFLSSKLSDGVSIPLPPKALKDWPIIGGQLHQLWSRAATDVGAQLREAAPQLKPLAAWLLGVASNVIVGLIKFLVSIIVAGFLFIPGPRLAATLTQFANRVLVPRGNEMVVLAGATIRNVSRGVIGVALLQSTLAGVGFATAGVPGAGMLAFASLVLGIIQIGPAVLFIPIILWSWFSMESLQALFFTAYMIPVGLVDVSRSCNTNACGYHRCHRRHDRLWNNRFVFRYDRSRRRMGARIGLDRRAWHLRGVR